MGCVLGAFPQGWRGAAQWRALPGPVPAPPPAWVTLVGFLWPPVTGYCGVEPTLGCCAMGEGALPGLWLDRLQTGWLLGWGSGCQGHGAQQDSSIWDSPTQCRRTPRTSRSSSKAPYLDHWHAQVCIDEGGGSSSFYGTQLEQKGRGQSSRVPWTVADHY